MYRKNDSHQLTFEHFYLPFGGHLRGDNRWVILAEQIPWSHIEQAYGDLFESDEGCPAKSARMVFGVLLVMFSIKLYVDITVLDENMAGIFLKRENFTICLNAFNKQSVKLCIIW